MIPDLDLKSKRSNLKIVEMPQPFIYINSWPGVGKHTIAKDLERQKHGEARVVSYSVPVLLILMSKALSFTFQHC